MRRAPADVKAIVFDLGGVLLRLRNPVEAFELTITEPEFLDLWLKSPSVREFERGAIDAESFAKAVVEELGLPMHWRRFLDRFHGWPQALFPDALPMLNAIPPGIRRVLLSNTNAAHWEREEISGALAGLFDLELLSFRTGLLKPDRAAFEQVLEVCGCSPREILFFDDNPGNVRAAESCGIEAYLSKGPEAALRRITAPPSRP
ncbi:MAG TPA: HAD family phosphatase [Woeseiaceae bacterium]|nr:HAD family phosphatase [Woeseiaceae bacterium]